MKLIPKNGLGLIDGINKPAGQYVVASTTGPLEHFIIPGLLYEANAWLGGPADRILVIRRLAEHQPSFDLLLKDIVQRDLNIIEAPFGLYFEALHYENTDQLAEDGKLRGEVQRIIGLLTICLIGDVACSLRSVGRSCEIEIFDQSIRFWADTEDQCTKIREICSRYRVEVSD